MSPLASCSTLRLVAALAVASALLCSGLEQEVSPASGEPILIQLTREAVPVRRKGVVVSHKTSYSGKIRAGTPPQEFKVVFDTGSGHVVLPASECKSQACLAHRRYNMSSSATAKPINVDGSEVLPGELCDQVTIGFGTGEVVGEFASERVCLGGLDAEVTAPCVDMHIITAVEMSTQPFKSFGFDGILGLGLGELALHRNFSFIEWLSSSKRVQTKQFGVFLTEGEDGEESEIAIGGHHTARMLDPIAWAPVAQPEHGYWQVDILAIRVDGVALGICADGTCRGVIDTGTSHLGVPAPFDREVAQLLTRPAGDLLDCRLSDAPVLEIELPGRNLTLHPENYMRRMPLRKDVNISSATGVTAEAQTERGVHQHTSAASVAATLTRLRSAAAATVPQAPAASGADAGAQQRQCRPRLMPVNLPEPLGPKLFILGEPVLHRYYTVFDWHSKQIGIALAANRRNSADSTWKAPDARGELPQGVEFMLLQKSADVSSALRL